jgi:hypothetical protein
MSTKETQIREVVVFPVVSNPLPAIVEQTAREVFDRFSDRIKARLNGRQEKALQLALQGHVTHKAARIYSVRSQDSRHHYLVDLDRKFCTCPDSRKGHLCKHRLAAYLIEQTNQATRSITNQGVSLEKVRQVLAARSDFFGEAIVYAFILYEGTSIQVEIVDLQGEIALVRALPKLKGDKMVPTFPFQDRKAETRVLASSLTEITIHR